MASLSDETLNILIEDGFSPEEIEMIDNTQALVDTAKLLPTDIENFYNNEYLKVIAGDPEGAVTRLFETSKTNPEFFQKLVALYLILNLDVNQNPEPPKVDDTILTRLPDDEYLLVLKNFLEKLKSLSNSDQKEFSLLLSQINEDQKAELIKRLKG